MRETLARAAYTLALRISLPFWFLKFWWRGRQEPLYRSHWRERLGGFEGQAVAGRIWLHAVSLGETLAVAPLITELRRQLPGVSVLLTHATATGRSAGAALLQAGDAQAWLPIDTPGSVRRFLQTHRPALAVMLETEIWPNLLHAVSQQGVPLVLASARLSARSLARGQRFSALLGPALRAFDLVLAQSPADAERFRSAGARQIQVAGNLKFDASPKPHLMALGRDWRAALSEQGTWPGMRPVVLAAVTREGEEARLLQAWLRTPLPRPLLLIVPRHPQRFSEVAALIAATGLALVRRSAWSDRPSAAALQADVWLGDTLGEMPLYYALAKVALLGGSFAPLGGQNLIEAAACGCPVLMGPHTFNFAAAAEAALAAGAAERVPSIEAAVARALALCQDTAAGPQAARALAFAAGHRGAAALMARMALGLVDGIPNKGAHPPPH
ncbi:MAG: 3-deoxy-D-manno-octulosonic acid transferase [Pseudomonadota bacterium]|nr:3-deoxy-D-manno-octulosonic acid transferase [Pseudomonadota bacterium]